MNLRVLVWLLDHVKIDYLTAKRMKNTKDSAI